MRNQIFSGEPVHVSTPVIAAVLMLMVAPTLGVTSFWIGTGFAKAVAAIERNYSA